MLYTIHGHESCFAHIRAPPQAILLTDEDLEPQSARGDGSAKPAWMGQSMPNHTGLRLDSGPPVPPSTGLSMGQSPASERPIKAAVGESDNELPRSPNAVGTQPPPLSLHAETVRGIKSEISTRQCLLQKFLRAYAHDNAISICFIWVQTRSVG